MNKIYATTKMFDALINKELQKLNPSQLKKFQAWSQELDKELAEIEIEIEKERKNRCF